MKARHWFRNDRLTDNTALMAAGRAERIGLLFVLDEALLAGPARGSVRVRFLHGCLERLAAELAAHDKATRAARCCAPRASAAPTL